MTAAPEPPLPDVPPGRTTPDWFYASVRALVRLIARLGLSFTAASVTGREHIPAAGGFIMATNHASHLDPPIISLLSNRPFTYLAKVELFRKPWFSRLIQRLGAFPIVRGGRDQQAIDRAAAFLRAGHAVVVFPEGTRTLTGKMGRIKSGAARLALRAGVPIVPAGIRGSFSAWPKYGRPRPHPVTVRIGPALTLEGLRDDEASYRQLTARLKEALTTLAESGS